MERVIINPIQCIDKYQEENSLMQSLMACGSSKNSNRAIKPAHVHIVYETIWLGKAWNLSYLKWKDAKDAQLMRKGNKIIGAAFPMRIVEDDPMRFQSIVARTDGPLFFNWMFHRAKALIKKRYYWFRANLVMAYENLYFNTLFKHLIVKIPKSFTGLYHARIKNVQGKKEFKTGNLIEIGNELSRKKRFFVVGFIPKRLQLIVVRADGLHYLFGLWKLRKIQRNPQLAELLLTEEYPEITIEEREPSRWQSLWPKPCRVKRFATGFDEY